MFLFLKSIKNIKKRKQADLVKPIGQTRYIEKLCLTSVYEQAYRWGNGLCFGWRVSILKSYCKVIQEFVTTYTNLPQLENL